MVSQGTPGPTTSRGSRDDETPWLRTLVSDPTPISGVEHFLVQIASHLYDIGEGFQTIAIDFYIARKVIRV